MRVLIVDDDTEKIRCIVQVLAAAGVDVTSIDESRNTYNARELLSSKRYDLLVLDVVLPERIDAEPDAKAGMKLLAEIRGRSKYFIPDHIIGLTAYSDVHTESAERFLGLGLLLLRYGRSREDWALALRSKTEQILWGKESARTVSSEYESDLAIVCALDDPELESVLKLRWNWQKWREGGDATVYHRGYFGGDNRIVYAAASARMGLTAAAVLATKMICSFRPKYIVNVGIAASFVGRANLGDVVASNLSWDYGSGKYAQIDGIGTFLQSPSQHQLDAHMRSSIGELARDDKLLHEVHRSWTGERPPTELRLIVGPVASGAAVIADGARSNEIAQQHRQLTGIDMESYAIFDAAAESAAPRPSAFCLKGVTDFADSNKDDRFRRYAAYASAECLRALMENYL